MPIRKYLNAAIAVVLLILILVGWWLLTRKLGPKDVSDAATALALLIGGSWTFYQFILRKSFESALSVDYQVQTEPLNQSFVVSLGVVLASIGNRRITRKLAAGMTCPGFAGWWPENRNLADIRGIPPHISLLYEYTHSDEKIDFSMEPGEKYTLSAILVLPAGHYAAKIVFVGERAKAAEYWSRIVYFCVPTPITSSLSKQRCASQA